MKHGKYVILLWVIMLTGCLSPVQTDTTNTYVISTTPNHIPKHAMRSTTILVLPPETRPIYNTTQMAYTNKPYQVLYFGRNQWAETPSQMFLPLIMQTLQNTNAFHAVVTPPYAGHYQYALSTQINVLRQNFLRHPNSVEITLNAQLTRVSSNRIVASKEFTVAVPIEQRTPYSGVVAANRAAGLILAELTNFTLQHT